MQVLFIKMQYWSNYCYHNKVFGCCSTIRFCFIFTILSPQQFFIVLIVCYSWIKIYIIKWSYKVRCSHKCGLHWIRQYLCFYGNVQCCVSIATRVRLSSSCSWAWRRWRRTMTGTRASYCGPYCCVSSTGSSVSCTAPRYIQLYALENWHNHNPFAQTIWNDVLSDKRREFTLCYNIQHHIGLSGDWIFCVSLVFAMFDVTRFPAFVGPSDVISSVLLPYNHQNHSFLMPPSLLEVHIDLPLSRCG